MPAITLHRPSIDELSFRQNWLADPATMAFNRAYGGTIDFPRERWADWYARWVEDTTGQRFYRYLYDAGQAAFVGEVSYRFDSELDAYICDVIVPAADRGRGCGSRGLALLCQAAKERGVSRLQDNIAADNPSVSIFLKSGFRETYRNDEYILVAKDL